MEAKHFNITVSGKVQGVYFRASAKVKADELAVKGFVCNQSNGNVYLEVEAEEEILYKFIKWCAQGPEHAIVEHVDVLPGVLVNYKNFEIRR